MTDSRLIAVVFAVFSIASVASLVVSDLVVNDTLAVLGTTTLDNGLIATDGAGDVTLNRIFLNSGSQTIGSVKVNVQRSDILAMTGTYATDFVVLPVFYGGFYGIIEAKLMTQSVGPTPVNYAATRHTPLRLFAHNVYKNTRVPLTPVNDWPFSFWSTAPAPTSDFPGWTRYSRQETGVTTNVALTMNSALVLGPNSTTSITNSGSTAWGFTLEVIYTINSQ